MCCEVLEYFCQKVFKIVLEYKNVVQILLFKSFIEILNTTADCLEICACGTSEVSPAISVVVRKLKFSYVLYWSAAGAYLFWRSSVYTLSILHSKLKRF